jgi:hypothetical protein
MLDQLLIVWNNPIPTREVEFNRWYSEVHIVDLLRVPGVGGATRFIRDDAAYHEQDARAIHRYLALYQLFDRHAVMRTIPQRRGTREMVLSDALDRTTSQATYTQAAGVPGGALTEEFQHLIVARLSHAPGRREPLERWFATAHLDEIAAARNGIEGRLYTLTVEQLRPHQPYAYFGIYTMPQTPERHDRRGFHMVERIRASIAVQKRMIDPDVQIDAYVPVDGSRDDSNAEVRPSDAQ